MNRDIREINRVLDVLEGRVRSLEIEQNELLESTPRNPSRSTIWYDKDAGKIVVSGPGFTHTFTKD